MSHYVCCNLQATETTVVNYSWL